MRLLFLAIDPQSVWSSDDTNDEGGGPPNDEEDEQRRQEQLATRLKERRQLMEARSRSSNKIVNPISNYPNNEPSCTIQPIEEVSSVLLLEAAVVSPVFEILASSSGRSMNVLPWAKAASERTRSERETFSRRSCTV